MQLMLIYRYPVPDKKRVGARMSSYATVYVLECSRLLYVYLDGRRLLARS